MGRGSELTQCWLVLMSALCLLQGARAPATGDVINVISVENMDTLLRMRLADDLPSLNESRLQRNADRTKRGTDDICQRSACQCATTASKWRTVSCSFSKHEILRLEADTMPDNLLELTLDNLAELTIESKTFSTTPALNKVTLSRIADVRVYTDAFYNISSAQFSFIIEDSGVVALGDQSFRLMKGFVRASITSCERIILGRLVFARLLHLHIRNVPTIELDSTSLAVETAKTSLHGPAPMILFENVTFGILPNESFPSSAHEIGFRDCRIQKISRSAFSAVEISRVFFQHTSVDTLEGGAFRERTFIVELDFFDVQIGTVESGIISAVNNLTLRDCTIGEVREGAFNVTAARLHIVKSYFTTIRRRAFDIHAWNDVIIHQNMFEKLDPDSFMLPFQAVSDVDRSAFQFTENRIKSAEVGSLAFIPLQRNIEVFIEGNIFEQACSCILKKWTSNLVVPEQKERELTDVVSRLFNTSLCSVTDSLAECFHLKAGAVLMANYTEQICGSHTQFLCEQPNQRYFPVDSKLDLTEFLQPEKKIVGIIFATVLICVTFILIVVTARWVQRKGLIGRIMSQFFRTSSLVATASISRVNIHEYAEIQNLRNQTQVPEEVEFEEEIVAVDDKATQTLPEELTQDLLQSLREKLDDPENYREARDMIEHLYDLIKVEETCNNRTSVLLEDSMYAELQPRTRARVRNKAGTSVGTRSPSIDRLDPVHYLPRPAVVNEYAEPRDRQVSSHVYCELPGGVPDVLMSSHIMANRPLPEAPGGSSSGTRS